MKLLITGGRKYADSARVYQVLDWWRATYPDLCIVNGGARGADALARQWCGLRGIPCITMDAHWDYFGRAAGSMRNMWMLTHNPDILFCQSFPGGTGTADMVRRCKEAGIIVYAA